MSTESQRHRAEATNARNRLVWLTFVRLVLYSLLLAAIAGLYLQGDAQRYPVSFRIIVFAVGAAFVASAFYAAWLRFGRSTKGLPWVQLVGDQLLWTTLVYLSGGPLSFATSLYGLSSVLAAVMLGVRGALLSAVLGVGLFLSTTAGFVYGVLVLPSDQPPFRPQFAAIAYQTMVTVIALFVVALLAAYLASRLQTESGRVVAVLERAERAERLAALGRIAAALAHEIRNPLGSISGSIDLIREHPALGDDERRLCDIIRSEANRLNELVTDMMNLARPRAPSFEPVDVARLARDVVELAQRSWRGQHDVPLSYEGPVSLKVVADPSMLRQLLWNLVRNALQASGAGTPVRVRVWQGEPATSVCVDIIDHGAGIPEEMRERVWDAFVTTRSHGVGIGLAVVRQIVDAHEASIEVFDTQGGGTTFRVVLPERSP